MPERTAKARIRDAALARFAARGFGASVKDIAAEAGVSPPLVMHHFHSKDGLRAACDDHVAALIRDRKVKAVEAGPDLGTIDVLRGLSTEPAVFRYLIRTLTEGSEQVNALVDQLVDDAVDYTVAGIERGLIKPMADVRQTTVVLLLWSLGTLVLHDHLKRLINVDLIDGDVEDKLRWFQLVAPLYSNGVLEPAYLEHLADAAAAPTPDVPPSEGARP